MPITFGQLLAALAHAHPPQIAHVTGDPDTLITAPIVESDADVQPGGVFVARVGLSSDGHDFIARAIERGAAAIVGERPIDGLTRPYAFVPNAQEAVGYLASAYHGFPSHKLTVIGVTGTDGKTTTSTLIHSILKSATGEKTGLISTISADIGGAQLDTGFHVTTPGAPMIQDLLAQMVANGLTHVVLEMTSHGLAQGRLNGVDIDVAVLTNLTHEHLDYHKTFENYRAAKARMFEMLANLSHKRGIKKTSVINADDNNAAYFAAIPAERTVMYGVHHAADFRASDLVFRPQYTQFVLRFAGHENGELMYLPLAGDFNVMNALAAISVTRGALNIPIDIVQKGLLNVNQISGRLERIDEGQPFVALVDFAHTPNALQNALKAARSMVGQGGRVIVVFGCAGLRDREKRRMMPATSTQLADLSIFTAEDPRTESLDDILATMAQAAIKAGGVEGKTFIRVPDRGEALYQACQRARAGDVVIACGKGHEQSMAFGTVEYAWDDREALRAALKGAPLKTLPTS